MSPARFHKLLVFVNGLFLLTLAATFFWDPYAVLFGNSDPRVGEAQSWAMIDFPERKPYQEYGRAIAGRRLYQAGLVVEAPVSKRSIVDDYQFLGSSRSPTGPRAFLRDTIGGKTRTVAVGDSVGDYSVAAIEPQGMTLKRGEETVLLQK